MASLFDDSKLPLWVWVLIIVVGSVVVLGTLAFVTRLLIVRRRQADFVDTFGDENLPQRKVTVRRGRVVEHSKYLSLTGSKFGLNAFAPDENDASSRAGARSKSPFEWWSTVKDRSTPRNSQLTQFTTTNETTSVSGMPTSPNHHRFYQRRDFNYSNASLGSTSKDEDVSVTVTESTPSSPPAAVKNFSRSFSRPLAYSKFSPRQNTLSRIEESSPHTSVISTRQSRVMSYISNKRDTKSSTRSSVPASPALASQFPEPPRWSTLNASRSSSIYHDTQEQGTQKLAPPPPVAYNGSRSSYGDPEPRLSHASNRTSHGDTSQNSKRESTMITALPKEPPMQQPNNYWETRKDLHPIRTSSKKGKVLRKKSLKKAEIVSKIDS